MSHSGSNVTFIKTDNEKFAFAYVMEKAVRSVVAKSENENENDKVGVDVSVYEGMDEFLERMGELRWLRNTDGIFQEGDMRRIEDGIKFRNDVVGGKVSEDSLAEIQFHVFPSRVFAKLSDYLKFLIGCSNRSRVTSRLVLIDSVANLYDCDMASSGVLIDSLFPPRSVLTLTAHPASLQYELQNIFDRGIFETIKLERESDRMSFTSGCL